MTPMQHISNQEGSISLPLAHLHEAIMAYEYKTQNSFYNIQEQYLQVIQYKAHTERLSVQAQFHANDRAYDISRRNDETKRLEIGASITFDATIRKKDDTQRMMIILGTLVSILTLSATVITPIFTSLN